MFLFSFLLIFHAQSQTVLTQTVGTSAFQVVTSREVKANELIARALEKEIDDSLIQVSSDSAVRVLTEVAIFREAQVLAAIKLSESELSELSDMVRKRLQKSSEWKKMEIADSELRSWVERKKVAGDFLKLKAATLAPIVTEQEIQEYYEKNRVKFGSTPLADQKANIRLYLQKENQRRRVQEWVSALRTKYQIRNDLAEVKSEAEAISGGQRTDTPPPRK